jgi:hypothetical protein
MRHWDLKVTDELKKMKLPWCCVFGNIDDAQSFEFLHTVLCEGVDVWITT